MKTHISRTTLGLCRSGVKPIKTNKKGEPIKLKKKWESKEEDFIAPADRWIMNKIIRRWKIYGKWLVKLDNSIYKLKRKLTRSK